MLDPKKILDDLLSAKVPGTDSTVAQKAEQAKQMAKDNPLAAGALAAVLLGTRAGRAVTGTALRVGGLAAVAGLAYKAWQNYQGGGKPQDDTLNGGELLPAPADSGFEPSAAPQGEDEFALTLIRAMIAAARSDGQIDGNERKRIGDRLALSGLGADAERFIADELDRPTPVDALVAAAQTDAQRVALYTAARLAVDPDAHPERAFLDALAEGLKLPGVLVQHVESTVAAAQA